MLSLLTIHLAQLRQCLTGAIRESRNGDAGLGTLEMVLLSLGAMAIAGIFLAALREGVTRRVDLLK